MPTVRACSATAPRRGRRPGRAGARELRRRAAGERAPPPRTRRRAGELCRPPARARASELHRPQRAQKLRHRPPARVSELRRPRTSPAACVRAPCTLSGGGNQRREKRKVSVVLRVEQDGPSLANTGILDRGKQSTKEMSPLDLSQLLLSPPILQSLECRQCAP